MTVHPVYRSILFSPKIWGLKFPSMVLCMLTLIAGFFLSADLGLAKKFLLTVLLAGGAFAALFWKDNRDEVAHHARKNCRLRKVIAGYCLSAHFIKVA